jgi:hypothetical protein
MGGVSLWNWWGLPWYPHSSGGHLSRPVSGGAAALRQRTRRAEHLAIRPGESRHAANGSRLFWIEKLGP